jgi:F-type H+-transporting ATPase subunit epsilon
MARTEMTDGDVAETMRLVVFTPAASILDETVTRLVAYGIDGAFGLRPRHVDFTAPLVPGILTARTAEDRELFIALDAGVLLKIVGTVRVATRRAVLGSDLGELRRLVREEFLAIDEREREIRGAAARLEAGMIRRFIEIEAKG